MLEGVPVFDVVNDEFMTCGNPSQTKNSTTEHKKSVILEKLSFILKILIRYSRYCSLTAHIETYTWVIISSELAMAYGNFTKVLPLLAVSFRLVKLRNYLSTR